MAQRANTNETGQERNDAARWTRRRLVSAGFDPALAGDLTEEAGIDLHELLGLVDCGCAPELALRILWPLDRERSGS